MTKSSDKTKQEKQSRPEEHGDLLIYYLEQRRRALITELRSVDQLMGRKQTIPDKPG